MPSRNRVLVTGTSSGIGQAVAQYLIAHDYEVCGLDISHPTINDPKFKHIELDLTDGQAIDRYLAQAETFDSFVHCAGVLRVNPVGALNPSDLDLMWRIHVAALTRLANIVIPRMVAQQYGRVVLVGSRVAQGLPGRSQYAATKAALIALAKSWAAETVADGVTVNVVSPAATQTAMLADPSRQSVSPKVPPIGRLIKPEEIASFVAYLLSPMAAPITGQDVQICGGATLPS